MIDDDFEPQEEHQLTPEEWEFVDKVYPGIIEEFERNRKLLETKKTPRSDNVSPT